MSLTFDEASHKYLWNGHPVPSVTQVLSDVGLIDYGSIPSNGTREEAMNRGRAVHLATQYDDEYLIGADPRPLDESTIADEHRPYVAAYRRFRNDTGFRPELIEYRQCNKQYGFAGMLDRTGTLPKWNRCLIDLKTGGAEFWVRLQLAAYASFFETPRLFTRVCVELHNDETYKLYVFSGRDWQADFNDFLYCLSVYRLKRERRMAAAVAA